jgi:hypothetical protein
VQDFHEAIIVRGGKRYAILADVGAFANTNGGTLYLGLSADPRAPVMGIPEAEHAIRQVEKEINDRISPPVQCTLDVHEINGKKIIRVLIPHGDDPPYAVDDNKIYVRSEAETGLAVRDEIVDLVIRGQQTRREPPPAAEALPAPKAEAEPLPSMQAEEMDTAPRTGVEVVSMEERNGARYYTMRDLRNGSVVKNVTRTSARRLWHYAITRFSHYPEDLAQAGIYWVGNLGLVHRYQQGKGMRYDLVQRTPQGVRYYFGVTEDGIHGPWEELVGQEDE